MPRTLEPVHLLGGFLRVGAPWSSQEARRVHTPKVVGSRPTGATYHQSAPGSGLHVGPDTWRWSVMATRVRGKYGGTYGRRAARVVAVANSNPATRCGVKARAAMVAAGVPLESIRRPCGEPLVSCGPNRNGLNRNGTPATWTAGHLTHDAGDDRLEPWCSACNYADGADHGNKTRGESPRLDRPRPRRRWLT